MDRTRPLAALALLGALCPAAPVRAQEKELRVDVALGVHQFSLSDVKDVYAALVQSYQGSGVSVPIQRQFPANLLVGVEASRRMTRLVTVGASADYTWTRAFALYGDATGQLDLTSSVKIATLQAVLRLGREPARGPLAPYVEARGGLAHASLELAQNIRLLPPIDAQTRETLSASGTVPTLEGAAGVAYTLGRLRLSAALGYRYAKVSHPEGTDVVNGEIVDSGQLPFDLNPSGVVARFRIGRSF